MTAGNLSNQLDLTGMATKFGQIYDGVFSVYLTNPSQRSDTGLLGYHRIGILCAVSESLQVAVVEEHDSAWNSIPLVLHSLAQNLLLTHCTCRGVQEYHTALHSKADSRQGLNLIFSKPLARIDSTTLSKTLIWIMWIVTEP